MPTVRQIAGVFARFGNLTLGGGSATIAVLHRELIEHREWLSEERFSLSFALSRLTPGTNLLAFCTSVGWHLRGFPGAIAALLAASIPCALIAAVVTALFSEWGSNGIVQAALHGAMAAAVGITVKTCWTLIHPHFVAGHRLRAALVAAAALVLHLTAGLSAVEVLLLSAASGALLPESAT